tara:strand:+ start:1126 stop:1665 length:540 start_codon:yes stop_codon:yes gene_type:complete
MSGNMTLGFGLNAGGTSTSGGGGTATGEVSTAVYEGVTTYSLAAGASTIRIGVSGSDFSVTTMDMKAGNTSGVALPLNIFAMGPLSYGATYRISGVLEITPSAASQLYFVTLNGGGYISTVTNIIAYTSVGTSLVELPFDTTTSSADVYGSSNTFKLNAITTAIGTYRIKSLTITLTNS